MRSDGSSRRRSGRGDEREGGGGCGYGELSLYLLSVNWRGRTLNGYKRTSIVFNTITLYQEHLKMQLNFSSLLTQKHTRVK